MLRIGCRCSLQHPRMQEPTLQNKNAKKNELNKMEETYTGEKLCRYKRALALEIRQNLEFKI